MGAVIFAFSDEDSFNAFAPGLALMGLGGSGVHIANFHISNLFPGIKSSIIATYSAAFAGSAILFPLLRVLYEVTSIKRKEILLMWAGLLAMMLIADLMAMPDKPFPLGAQISLGSGSLCRRDSLLVVTTNELSAKKTLPKKGARPMKTIKPKLGLLLL